MVFLMSLVIINSYLIFLFFFDIMHYGCEPLKMVTTPSHQCLRCDYSATQKSILQTHIETIHEGKKFPCSQCESTFTQTGSLKTHIKSVHNGLKFPCTQCTVGQFRGFCPMGILSNMELSVEVCARLLQSVPMGAAECVQGYRVIKYFLKFLKNIFWRKKIF